MHIKSDFPLFANNPDLVYLDSAATLQKPQCVIDEVTRFLSHDYANIHRGRYSLAERSEEAYWQARKTVAEYIGAKDESEIVFTHHSTHAVNILARSLIRSGFFQAGDSIVLTSLEHHANILPWQMVAEMHGVTLRWIDIAHDGVLPVQDILEAIDETTKIVALTLCSNVTGMVWDDEIKKLSMDIKKHNENTSPLFVLDVSQYIVHRTMDVQSLWGDICFFTWHKLGALTGIGVLRGKSSLLWWLTSGYVWWWAIEQVMKHKSILLWSPDAFEPGTPDVVWALSLARAIQYIQHLDIWPYTWYEAIDYIEQWLMKYCLQAFRSLEDAWHIRLLGNYDAEKRIGLFSFIPLSCSIEDIAQLMEEHDVALRTWAHCAHVYHAGLAQTAKCGVQKTCRISLWAYNELADVEKFFAVLEHCL